ncbi:MAG: hypothetical protein AAFV25_23770, partial [Bacteroidota bacterium]
MPNKSNQAPRFNVYDRIFKENSDAVFLPLLESHLGIRAKSFKALKDKISKTIEREMDMLYELVQEDGEKMLLHIEFQTRNDPSMLYRMAEYHGLAFAKYRLPIRHVLMYLGSSGLRMRSELTATERFEGFDVINFQELDREEFLRSSVPEVVVMSSLADLGTEEIRAIEQIKARLASICITKSDLDKYTTQLRILLKLHNLSSEILKIINDMSFFDVNVEDDPYYQKGVERGLEQGEERGVKKNFTIVVQKMLAKGLTPEWIAST